MLHPTALLALPLLLALIATAPSAAECSRTLTVAATGLWGNNDRESVESAADRRWLYDIAAEAGFCITAETRETLIARRLSMIETGTVDMLVGASRTPERERYAWFSAPYREEKVLLYVRSDRREPYRQLRNFADLQALSVPWLVVRDSWLGPDYSAARKTLLRSDRVFEFDNYPQGVAMLRFGRGEVLLAPDSFGYYLQREQITDIVALAPIIHQESVHFMLSKASVSAAELARFDAAIKHVQQLGGPRPN